MFQLLIKPNNKVLIRIHKIIQITKEIYKNNKILNNKNINSILI